MTDVVPPNIADAVLALKKKYPKVQVISSTKNFLTATYQRAPNAHVKVKFTLTFVNGYSPSLSSEDGASVVVGIEGSVNVAPGLKRKLVKDLTDLAKQQKSGSTYHQVDAVLKGLINFIDTNMFVPCWKELRQVVELINNSGGNDDDESPKQQPDTIRLVETKGLIRLDFQPRNGKYQYKCSITIDPAYPNTSGPADYGKPCRFKMESTNLPTQIEKIITLQAQELVRRCQDGMSEDQVLKMSNPVHLPVAGGGERPDGKSETPQQTWQREEDGRLKLYGIKVGHYDGSKPQPSLLSLVTFLRSAIHQLADTNCPSCHEKCLPMDSAELVALYKAKTAKAKRSRPMPTHCGCWYHVGCLDSLMNEPPFGVGAICEGCSKKQLFHPCWPEEAASERQRIYTQRQMKEREIADAADCF